MKKKQQPNVITFYLSLKYSHNYKTRQVEIIIIINIIIILCIEQTTKVAAGIVSLT